MTSVFISYTAIENDAVALSAEQHGCIDVLHGALELRLEQFRECGDRVWHDPPNADAVRFAPSGVR